MRAPLAALVVFAARCAVAAPLAHADPLSPDRYDTLTLPRRDAAWERGPVDALVQIDLYFAPGHAGAASTGELLRKAFDSVDGRRSWVAFRQVVHLVPPRGPYESDLVSEALVEAAAQGSFYALFDRLVQVRSPPAQRAEIVRLAADAGLDVAELNRALDTRRHESTVLAMWQPMIDDGHFPAELSANGRRLSTWMSTEALDTAMAAAARRAEALLDAGSSSDGEGLSAAVAVARLCAREREQQLAIDSQRLPRRTQLIDEPDARRGPGFAPIQIRFFGTLGHPTATEWASALRRIQLAYPGVVAIEWKNAVVLRGSSDEWLMTLALQAERQGLFWELYDAVFHSGSRSGRRTPLEIEAIARRIGVDLEAATSARVSGASEKAAQDRRGELNRLGLGSVPTVILNGMVLPQGLAYERLRRYVEGELARGIAERERLRPRR